MQRGTEQADWVDGLMRAHLQAQHEDGNDIKACSPHGFEGIACGHVTYGEREGLLLAQVKSGLADEIAKELKSNGVQTKITRTDWQATVCRSGASAGYAETVRTRARGAIEQIGGTVPQTTVVFEGPNAADSCYIRTGRGDSVFRAYNKTAESPGSYPLNTWRYELQLRGKRARGSWKMFESATNSTWLARSLVSGFMLQYDLEESWQLSNTPCPSPSRYEASDTARRLEWWRSTVVAVAEKLIDAGIDVHELTRPLLEKSYTKPRRNRSSSLKVFSSNVGQPPTKEPEHGNVSANASLFDVGQHPIR